MTSHLKYIMVEHTQVEDFYSKGKYERNKLGVPNAGSSQMNPPCLHLT